MKNNLQLIDTVGCASIFQYIIFIFVVILTLNYSMGIFVIMKESMEDIQKAYGKEC